MRFRFVFICSVLNALIAFSQPVNRPVQKFDAGKTGFNGDWEFAINVDSVDVLHPDRVVWENITLPHTSHIEPMDNEGRQWQGFCFYRKNLLIPQIQKGKHIAIQFEGVMQDAEFFLNGEPIFHHVGGYLPVYLDISDKVIFGQNNQILVKVDNRNNAHIPPGKPMSELDFNYYGGIYRNVWLIVKEKIHIADAVGENNGERGGVLVHFDSISDRRARLSVKTDIINLFNHTEDAQISIQLRSSNGVEISKIVSAIQKVDSQSHRTFDQSIILDHPEFWSPEKPNLYLLTVQLLVHGVPIDQYTTKTGIKNVKFSQGSFFLNDHVYMLRGTNRHQEYPYVGYAISNNAEYRDGYKIKAAGFNFVRCSHYPPSPAFLDACDELGLLVIDATPGWQFFGDSVFQKNSLQNIRDMIHRDRNHASVFLWEASLNETDMSVDFMKKAQAIVHKELPFNDIYTCGWRDEVYDVFIPARQHAKAPEYWKKYQKKPLLIAEYGDWEYYAQNAGFNQANFDSLKTDEQSSRQLLTSGEKGLLQQALNFQEAHNDNLKGEMAGDANWVMFDYKRGYARDIESSGIMDICRLPKFSYYFYQSQYRNPKSDNAFGKPMIFIASYWNTHSNRDVKVFSNCEEVALLLNGKVVARQKPDSNNFSDKLDHPPFTFRMAGFQPGILTAIGFEQGKEIIRTERRTVTNPGFVKLSADISGKSISAEESDLIFVYARIQDSHGELVTDSSTSLLFSVSGNAELIGTNPVKTEAGIATILLKTKKGNSWNVSVSSDKGFSDTIYLNSKSF